MRLSVLAFQVFVVATLCNRSSAIVLNCNFFTAELPQLGDIYVCFLRSIEEPENPAVIKVTGIHLEDKNDSDVDLFYTARLKLDNIPQGLEKFFVNLKGLLLYEAGVKVLTKNDLKPFPNLSYLMMKRNKINELADDVFEFTPNISYINFNRNNLKVIGRDLLKSLPNLRFASFSNNPCVNRKSSYGSRISEINEAIDNCFEASETSGRSPKNHHSNFNTTFEENPPNKTTTDNLSREQSVDALTDSSNNNEKSYEENENWMNDECDTNSLVLVCDEIQLKLNSTCNAVNFNILVEHQRLTELRTADGTIVDGSKVLELSVLNQHATFLPLGIGQICVNLEKLIVINSRLTIIKEEALKGLHKLKVINLAANNIAKVSASDLTTLSELTILDFSNNQIKTLPNGIFDAMPELQEVKLSGNRIEEIDDALFAKNLKLTKIDLQDNKIKFVGNSAFDSLSDLIKIDLSGNVCINSTDKSNLKEALLENCTKPLIICCLFWKLSDCDSNCRVENLTSLSPKAQVGFVISREDCKLEPSRHTEDNKQVKEVNILEIIDENCHYLPANLGEHFVKVEKLIIDNSQLKALRKEDFSGFLVLNTLEIVDNGLKTLPTGVFNTIPRLINLDVSYNEITEVPKGFFHELPNLNIFKASRNQIKKLEGDLFPRPNALQEIHFDHNEMTTIDTQIFRYLGKIKVMNFRGNTCIWFRYPEDAGFAILAAAALKCT